MKKYMKKALVLAASVISMGMLSGCEETTKDATSAYKMPEGMEDCKVFYMSGKDGSNIIVVRCPNATTTTRSGKSTNVTVVDGATVETKVLEAAQTTQAPVQKSQNTDEVQINGETYRKSDTMKEVEINGETYKKVQ